MVDCDHNRYCHHHRKMSKLVFLGQYLTDANFHGDFCPYQQYFSYYCPDFGGHNFCTIYFLDKTSFDPNFFWPKMFSNPKIFWQKKFSDTKIFRTQFFFYNPSISKLNTFNLSLVSCLVYCQAQQKHQPQQSSANIALISAKTSTTHQPREVVFKYSWA